MRKITKEAANAFNNHRFFQSGETRVFTYSNGSRILELHGSSILHFDGPTKTLTFSLCGHGTLTTRERLSPWVSTWQRKGEQFARLPHDENAPILESGRYLLQIQPSEFVGAEAREASRLIWGAQAGDFGSIRAALHAEGVALPLAIVDEAQRLCYAQCGAESRELCLNYLKEFSDARKVA